MCVCVLWRRRCHWSTSWKSRRKRRACTFRFALVAGVVWCAHVFRPCFVFLRLVGYGRAVKGLPGRPGRPGREGEGPLPFNVVLILLFVTRERVCGGGLETFRLRSSIFWALLFDSVFLPRLLFTLTSHQLYQRMRQVSFRYTALLTVDALQPALGLLLTVRPSLRLINEQGKASHCFGFMLDGASNPVLLKRAPTNHN